MKFSELKRLARRSLEGRWGLVVGATFLFLFLVSPFDSILSPFAYYYQITSPKVYDNGDIFALLLSNLKLKLFSNPKAIGEHIDDMDTLWGFLVSGVLYLGLVKILLMLSRYEDTGISGLFTNFRSFRLFWRGFWAVLLQGIYGFLWTLLFIVPGIVKGYSYAMTNYIVIDHPELSVNEAITKSRQMMDGHKWEYFVLYLTFFGWGILCLLSIGIGFLWLIPYMEATYVQFYLKVSSEDNLVDEVIL